MLRTLPERGAGPHSGPGDETVVDVAGSPGAVFVAHDQRIVRYGEGQPEVFFETAQNEYTLSMCSLHGAEGAFLVVVCRLRDSDGSRLHIFPL